MGAVSDSSVMIQGEASGTVLDFFGPITVLKFLCFSGSSIASESVSVTCHLRVSTSTSAQPNPSRISICISRGVIDCYKWRLPNKYWVILVRSCSYYLATQVSTWSRSIFRVDYRVPIRRYLECLQGAYNSSIRFNSFLDICLLRGTIVSGWLPNPISKLFPTTLWTWVMCFSKRQINVTKSDRRREGSSSPRRDP